MKPKKLTLREIHLLYLTLKDSLPEREEQYLLDEVESMINRMKNGYVLVQALHILYPNKNINTDNPLELLVLFIRGLKVNDFFEYAYFIRGLKSVK